MRSYGHVYLTAGPGPDPEHSGGIISLGWPAWMYSSMDEWIYGWINGWNNGWMDDPHATFYVHFFKINIHS